LLSIPEFASKPVDPEQLLEKIKRSLE